MFFGLREILFLAKLVVRTVLAACQGDICVLDNTLACRTLILDKRLIEVQNFWSIRFFYFCRTKNPTTYAVEHSNTDY